VYFQAIEAHYGFTCSVKRFLLDNWITISLTIFSTVFVYLKFKACRQGRNDRAVASKLFKQEVVKNLIDKRAQGGDGADGRSQGRSLGQVKYEYLSRNNQMDSYAYD
jgi:hypothetical protein